MASAQDGTNLFVIYLNITRSGTLGMLLHPTSLMIPGWCNAPAVMDHDDEEPCQSKKTSTEVSDEIRSCL
jgi:hypothetical protein